MNVAGQALVPTVVAKREGLLDVARYESSSAADLFSDDAAVPSDGAAAADEGVAADEHAADEADDRQPVSVA